MLTVFDNRNKKLHLVNKHFYFYFYDCAEPLQKTRGSLPDLRHDCHCPRRYDAIYCGGRKSALYRMHESSGSTESLLEEADEFVRHCNDGGGVDVNNKKSNRRCSEADIIHRGM
jgi:hypothetical protein